MFSKRLRFALTFIALGMLGGVAISSPAATFAEPFFERLWARLGVDTAKWVDPVLEFFGSFWVQIATAMLVGAAIGLWLHRLAVGRDARHTERGVDQPQLSLAEASSKDCSQSDDGSAELAKISLLIDARPRLMHGADNIITEPIRLYTCTLKSKRRFAVSRVVCLCQRPGQDFSVELSGSVGITTLQAGEERKIVVAHFTQDSGHQLGPPLDEPDEMARIKMKALSHFSGTMRCRLVVETDQGDVCRDFNLTFFNDGGPPNLTDCRDFKGYNPDHPIPANGWYLG